MNLGAWECKVPKLPTRAELGQHCGVTVVRLCVCPTACRSQVQVHTNHEGLVRGQDAGMGPPRQWEVVPERHLRVAAGAPSEVVQAARQGLSQPPGNVPGLLRLVQHGGLNKSDSPSALHSCLELVGKKRRGARAHPVGWGGGFGEGNDVKSWVAGAGEQATPQDWMWKIGAQSQQAHSHELEACSAPCRVYQNLQVIMCQLAENGRVEVWVLVAGLPVTGKLRGVHCTPQGRGQEGQRVTASGSHATNEGARRRPDTYQEPQGSRPP